MLAFEGPIANLAGTKVERWIDSIEKSRLAYSTMTAEKRNLASDQFFNIFNTSTLKSRNLIDRVVDRFIDGFYFIVDCPKFIVVEIALVEDDNSRDMVRLSGDQKSVDESSGGARKAKGGDKTELVDIGGYDMSLLGEFCGAANDVVATVGDICYHTSSILDKLKRNTVADSDRVGLFVATDAVIATQTAVDNSAVGEHDAVPAACCSNN